jgi:hypothetical protein
VDIGPRDGAAIADVETVTVTASKTPKSPARPYRLLSGLGAGALVLALALDLALLKSRVASGAAA